MKILRILNGAAFVLIFAAALFADALVASNAAEGFIIMFAMLFVAGLLVFIADRMGR